MSTFEIEKFKYKVGDAVWNVRDRARGKGKIIEIKGDWVIVNGWSGGKKKVFSKTLERDEY